jgi:hypothetical protein
VCVLWIKVKTTLDVGFYHMLMCHIHEIKAGTIYSMSHAHRVNRSANLACVEQCPFSPSSGDQLKEKSS